MGLARLEAQPFPAEAASEPGADARVYRKVMHELESHTNVGRATAHLRSRGPRLVASPSEVAREHSESIRSVHAEEESPAKSRAHVHPNGHLPRDHAVDALERITSDLPRRKRVAAPRAELEANVRLRLDGFNGL
jgi:hypothetical protein